MRSRTPHCSRILRFFIAPFALTFGLAICGQAAVKDRIVGTVGESSRASLAHTVAPRVSVATDLGAAPSTQVLETMTMHFSMTAAQQAALTQLLADQQDPGSPHYHQWLTPRQFGAQFGLSAGDVAKVSAWLTAQGFTVTGTANSSTFVTFRGTVGQVQRAFGTTLHTMSLDGEQHVANLSEPTLPVGIAAVVANIAGLNDFRLKPRLRHRSFPMSSVHPQNTITTGKGIQHFLAPGDFYTIYNVNPLLSSGIDGTGVTIAVMGQVDLSQSDVAAFRTASGLSANVPAIKTYGSDPGSPSAACLGTSPPNSCFPSAGDLEESLLDVEWSGAVAPSAQIVFVNSQDVIGISLVQAIDDNIAPIMTVSYGDCETAYSATERNSLNQAFQQANAQGITVVGPTGDSGATDCDDTGVQSATHGLAVDFPASSPFVTAVGGTEFNEGPDTAGTYWNATNGTNAGSAKTYIPEGVWNDTAADLVNYPKTAVLSGGGGGASVEFGKPSWQTGVGVPNDGARDLPDVSFSSSVDHDASLVCAEGSCTAGTYLGATGNFNAFGGTSVSTPSFAGILALVEQKNGGTRLGNVNPAIYKLASSAAGASIFHDVTTGDNKSPCTSGSTGCPSGGSIGYSAAIGYDQATGWGSVDAYNFATKFATVVSATALTAAPATPSLGQTFILTANVTSAGSAVPTGTVTFAVNGTTTGSPVALSSGGAATYTTSSNDGGQSTYTAAYSGDANYLSSTGTDVVTVAVPPGAAATTTAVAATPGSVALGSSVALTATVSSGQSGTPSGIVTFKAGTVNLGTARVAGSGANTATASLTILATARTLPIGNDSVTAIYGGGAASGGATYTGSTSAAATITVTNPVITLTATAITIPDGSSGTSTITVTSNGGYAGTVNLTASTASSTLGNYATIQFNPTTVSLVAGAQGTSTFTLSTPTSGAVSSGTSTFLRSGGGVSMVLAGSGLSFAGLLLLGFKGTHRKRVPALLLSLVTFTLLATGVGCSSSSSTGGGGTTTTTLPIPKGTYTVTVTGTDSTTSAISGSANVTLTLN